jgi:hypothetical protein
VYENLKIPLAPVWRGRLESFLEVLLARHEFACRLRPVGQNSAYRNNELPGLGVQEPGNSGIILCCRAIETVFSICERIREAIVADKCLSLYAQNIEIFAGPKGVTLYGTVKSQEERKRIEIDVAAVVKGGNVFNKLVVRPNQHLSQTKSSRRHESNKEPSTEEEYGRIRRLWGIRERPRL